MNDSAVYKFQCDSCDASYVGYTIRHLFQRADEHRYSVIGKHYKDQHQSKPCDVLGQFSILKKCRGKLDCLMYDSVKAKLFVSQN